MYLQAFTMQHSNTELVYSIKLLLLQAVIMLPLASGIQLPLLQ